MMNMQNQGLPAMLDARLTAPKVLKMHKVATYTQSKLQDQSIPLHLVPVPLPAEVCSGSPISFSLQSVCVIAYAKCCCPE